MIVYPLGLDVNWRGCELTDIVPGHAQINQDP
jgi:hypothetical protein